jgi:methyl-accepting chemotaxis protein
MQGSYHGEHARIKNALNQAADNLDDGLSQVALGIHQVAAAAVEISTGSTSLSQAATEQASTLEEISCSLQEMSSMTGQSAMNAREAKGIAEETRISSEKGFTHMKHLSEVIERIKQSSDQTARIVKTIDEIAFQTNLLALNAAVEAARAGEAGQGFAVVAGEVRSLAMRSAEAAKNTANLIEEAVKNTQEGVSVNKDVLNDLEEIHLQATRVNEVMGEIALSVEQQSMGIEQVTTAVEQLNSVTQQNAASSEESASASEELSSQVDVIQNMVSSFTLSAVNGNRSNTSATSLKRVTSSEIQPDSSTSWKPLSLDELYPNGNGHDLN